MNKKSSDSETVIKPVVDLLKEALIQWWDDNTFRLAASLSFYMIFSMAPVFLIAVQIASLVFSRQAAQQKIAKELTALVGAHGGEAIRQVLRGIGSIGGNPLAVLLGIVAILVGSTAVFAELQSALNLIWDVKVDPQRSAFKSLLRTRLRSFALVLAVGFLLLVFMALSAAASAAQDLFAGWVPGAPWLWRTVNLVIPFIVIALLFAIVYKYLPDVRISWGDVAIGSLVTALLFTLGKSLIGLYLGHTAIASSYGAAGSFVLLLLWVYYSALISFFGAEFTQVYARRFGSRIRPEAHAVFIGRKQHRRTDPDAKGDPQ